MSLGQKQCTGLQSITGLTYIERQPFTLSFTPTDNSPTLCVWTAGGNQSTHSKPTQIWGIMHILQTHHQGGHRSLKCLKVPFTTKMS